MSNRKRDNYQTLNNRIHSLKSSTLETFGRTTVTNKSMIGECKRVNVQWLLTTVIIVAVKQIVVSEYI